MPITLSAKRPFSCLTVRVKDYRRALDFVFERSLVDTNGVGLVGYSMGGMDSFYLLSVEPRIKVAVACVPPLLSIGYGPASPVDYSGASGRRRSSC